MIRLFPMSVLAGCPYVFGPADLSNVAGPIPADPSGPTADTGPDTDPTGPTGDTGPLVLGPVVTGVQVRPLIAGLDLAVTFSPAGALAKGGALLVAVDGAAPLEALVPGDVRLVGTDVLRWTLPVPASCDGYDHDLSISIRDPLGVGPATIVEVALQGLGTPQELPGVADLGVITPPVVLCGTANMVGEADRFMFQSTIGGSTVFVLSWVGGPNTDLDYTVTDALGYPIVTAYGVVNPEVLAGVLVADAPYELAITHFSGPPPFDWQMTFLPETPATTIPTVTETGGTGDTGP